MKAVEARKKSKKNLLTTVPERELSSIMRRIKYATYLGEFKIWTEEDTLTEVAIKKLKRDGYSVKKCFFGGGYNISWN